MTERDIQRALWWDLRSTCSCAMPNFTPREWFECDVCAVTKAGYFVEYEIKLSKSDLKADAKKSSQRSVRTGRRWRPVRENKHALLKASDLRGPSRFMYIVPESLVEFVPQWAGIITARSSDGRTYLRIRRQATRLHTHKVDRPFIAAMHYAAYWRYWNIRAKVESEPPIETPGVTP